MKPQEIILDTDIGDDIDDALALAVIVNSPELNLRGVTTVFRNAPRRAVLARHLLDTYKIPDVPVVAGCSRPLLQPYDPELGTQFQILEDDVWNDTAHAVDFIVEAARVNEEPDPDNRLTLVPIGPLTNIAVALARSPELVPRVRIVLMGGQWSQPGAEWNILCDPEAAAMVFNSGAEISMIGLDVTLRCRLEPSHIERIAAAGTERSRLVHRLIKLWQGDGGHPPILHDPLAVLTLFDDSVKFEDKRIEVELCGEGRGRTVVVEGEPNARVAVDVDVARAVDVFMSRVLDQP